MGSRLQAFFGELRRRNVLRVAGAYLVAGWVALQIVDILGPGLGLPDWAAVAVAIVVLVGLPTALLVAWYFEITPSGLVPTDRVSPEDSITRSTARRIDRLIIALLAIALAFFVVDAVLQRVAGDFEAAPSHGYHSLAILPQLDIQRGQGITGQLAREIATVLASVPELPVTPMEVVENLRAVSAPESASRELGVRFLLLFDGSGSEQSKTWVRLYDAMGDEVIWETSVQPNAQNALALRSAIARQVVERLGVLTTAEADSLLAPPTEDSEAYAHYLRGRLLAADDARKFEEVADQFRKAIELDDRFALPYAGLCNAFIRQYQEFKNPTDFQEAEKNCHRSLTLGRYRGPVLEAMGDLYLASGQPRRAEESFRTATQINPSSINAILGLGRSRQQQGDLEQAESLYNQAISAQPSYSQAYNALAVNYYMRGDYSEALAQLDIATTLAPQSPDITNNHAALYMMLGEFDVTVSLLKPIVEAHPEKLSQVSNLGTAYYFAGTFEKAVEEYKKAVELAPNAPAIYRNLGDAYLALRDTGLANDAFSKAVARSLDALKINPEDQTALTSAAVAYASMGDQDEFHALEPNLLNLADAIPNIAYDLAVAYCRLGYVDNCRREIDRAIRIGFPRLVIESEPALGPALAERNVETGDDSQ